MKKRVKVEQRKNVLRHKIPPRWHEAVIVDYARLMAWPGVERISLGWKERNGKMTSRFCVKIYVQKKRAKPKKGESLPKSAKVLMPIGKGLYQSRWIPTDVIWNPAATLCSGVRDFLNPAVGGALLATPGGDFGSYACMVTVPDGRRFALTAGHVVQPFPGNIPQNRPVVQPSSDPPGLPSGESILFGRTRGGFFGNTADGFLDFSLIELRPGRSGISAALDGLANNGTVLPPSVVINGKIRVTKFGATTGRTNGVFSALLNSIVIDGMTVTSVYEFKGLPGKLFGDSGDSGALVISVEPGLQGGVVGLLFATTLPTPDAPFGRGFVFPFGRMTGLRPI